jgi:hypothetical protein
MLSWIFVVLVNWNKSMKVDMLSQLDSASELKQEYEGRHVILIGQC